MKGCPYAPDRARSMYDQTNNAIEQILRKYKNRKVVSPHDYLESCGTESVQVIRESMGKNMETGYPVQPADILLLAFNDPANYRAMRRVFNVDPDRYLGNEIPEWYQAIVPLVFPDTRVQFENPITWKQVTEFVSGGHGVQLLLKNPGHFIGVILYDEEKDILHFNDTWKYRAGLKNGGFLETLTKEEFEKNCFKKANVFF